VNSRGFILIGVTVMMLIIAVTSVVLNRKAGLQLKMADNHHRMVQTAMAQRAAVEEAIWELTEDPMWWTDAANKDYTSDGVVYTRTVQKSAVGGYTDTTMVAVTAPGSQVTATAAVRYYIRPPIAAPGISSTVQQLCMDAQNNIFFAVKDDHVIYRRDAVTGSITIFAGSGSSGDSGEGGPATSAQLNAPEGVAIDAAGDIYIADTGNHRIKKVSTATGIINNIAGTGTGGYDGDGGQATSSQLNGPRGVAISGSGVVVCDTDNHRIREIDGSTGKIDTVAGTGTAGDSGDAGKADSAEINRPHGIYLDALNDLVFADTDNNRIRVVRYSDNDKIYAYAGTGTEGYSGDTQPAVNATLDHPKGVFVSGIDVYIADTDNHVVRKVTNSTGNIDTIAGTGFSGYTGDGGPPTLATLDKPIGVWVDGTGRIVAGDSNNEVLRRIAEGTSISSLYSPGGLGLSNPRHVALDPGGDLYVADSGNHRIRKLSAAGDISTVAGTGSGGYSGDGGPAISAQLKEPGSIALDAVGDIYIADTGNHCIRKITVSTGNISRIAGTCETGGYTGNGGPAIDALLDGPYGIEVATSGTIYVADYYNCWIRKFTEGGSITRYAGAEDDGDPSCGSAFTGQALTTQLKNPLDIHVDAAGNGYIADTENHKIWKVNVSGEIARMAGTGSSGYTGDGGLAVDAEIDAPRGLTLDSTGNLYFTDRDRHVVRVVSSHNDFIYTLAGTGSPGYNGTDMPAILTRFNRPAGIEILTSQSNRRIYVCDWDNSRIRILDYTIEKVLN